MILVLALAAALWACGGDTTPPTVPDPTSSPTTAQAVETSGASGVTTSTGAAVTPESSEATGTAEGTTTTSGQSGASTTTTSGYLSAPEVTGPSYTEELVSSKGAVFPKAPSFPDGPITEDLRSDLDAFFDLLAAERRIGQEELEAIASHGDPRTAWVFSDVLRFANSRELYESIGAHLQDLLGDEAFGGGTLDLWKDVTDLLIAWDLPAFAEYREYKKRLFVLVEPKWEPFFSDADAAIDWRWLSWGGVFIDDRPLGATTGCPRGCIPALDDPPVTPAAAGGWYPDEAVVFGVTINGESRAYPKHQMEIHEMVNDTLGGERIGMPYCTLCGSAQAYLTDQVPVGVETPVLRTSGLLSRSNKVMYDLITKSVFDTFTGDAVSGPLQEAGVRLPQATVVASTWAAWKKAHPDTTILAEDGGLGRIYPLDPLQGRDDHGPIFPVGDVDARLDVQALVVGVELEDGTTIAFDRQAALTAIDEGRDVVVGDVQLIRDGDGLRVVRVSDGSEIPAHQAFWFAWSQFWPDTLLWSSPPV